MDNMRKCKKELFCHSRIFRVQMYWKRETWYEKYLESTDYEEEFCIFSKTNI